MNGSFSKRLSVQQIDTIDLQQYRRSQFCCPIKAVQVGLSPAPRDVTLRRASCGLWALFGPTDWCARFVWFEAIMTNFSVRVVSFGDLTTLWNVSANSSQRQKSSWRRTVVSRPPPACWMWVEVKVTSWLNCVVERTSVDKWLIVAGGFDQFTDLCSVLLHLQHFAVTL